MPAAFVGSLLNMPSVASRTAMGSAPLRLAPRLRACSIRHTASTATSSFFGRCVKSSGESSNVIPSAR